MSLLTTLAHRMQSIPVLSHAYEAGQRVGARLQPTYQEVSRRVERERPAKKEYHKDTRSTDGRTPKRAIPKARKEDVPQDRTAPVDVIKTQPQPAVQSVAPPQSTPQQEQAPQETPTPTLTSFIVGATRGAQDAGQRFAERHPGATKVVHAPLERMATTIHKSKERTEAHQRSGEEKAEGIEPSVISRTAYEAGTAASGKIRQIGWESAEYYRKEMPTTGKYFAGVATVSTTAVSRIPEFLGMLPGGVETMTKRPEVIPAAVAVGLHGATVGTAEEFIHHPVQTSADIGAFMAVGAGVGKGGSLIGGRVKPKTPTTPSAKPAPRLPAQSTQTHAPLSIAASGKVSPRATPKLPAQTTQTPLNYAVQTKGGKTTLAPSRRTLYEHVHSGIGKARTAAVTAKQAASRFKPPNIQVVKTVKGFKSTKTTTPSATASSVKPAHKTRLAINKKLPTGKQDVSGTYDVAFTQKTSKSHVPNVKGQKYTKKTEGTGQQVIEKHTAPDTLVEKKTGGYLKRKQEIEVVPGETTYRSKIIPDEITKTRQSEGLFIETPSKVKTTEASKTKIIKDEPVFKKTGFMGGKKTTYQKVMPQKAQLFVRRLAKKIPKKTQAAPVRSVTLKEPHDAGTTVGSSTGTRTGLQQVTLLKQKETTAGALKHKGEVVSQVYDVSLNVPLAPSARIAAAAAASATYAGAISHGYAESDYDYSTVYPSSAFTPAVISPQEATGYENIPVSAVVPLAATKHTPYVVPITVQKPATRTIQGASSVQKTVVNVVPSYATVTQQYSTHIPHTEIIPVQRESVVAKQNELYRTDTVYKTDTVQKQVLIPHTAMEPGVIPIHGGDKSSFLKKKKKKKGRLSKRKERKVATWYPAALESVTAEQFKSGGKLTQHIPQAKTTRKLMREFITTGRGIPTAKQHKKSRGN